MNKHNRYIFFVSYILKQPLFAIKDLFRKPKALLDFSMMMTLAGLFIVVIFPDKVPSLGRAGLAIMLLLTAISWINYNWREGASVKNPFVGWRYEYQQYLIEEQKKKEREQIK